MLKLENILFMVLFIAPAASAEVFKCVTRNGMDLYQNFPCQFDSIGWAATDAQVRTKLSTPSDSSSTIPKQVASPAAAPGRSGTVPADVRIGMTTEEVRAIWGEPTDTVLEEPGSGPRTELWSYGTSRSVRFNRRGRVTALQQ